MDHHLVQFNVARFHAPIDDPVNDGFTKQLEPVNAVADAAPGFVWRLQTDDGDATSIRLYDDDLVVVNMSIWTDVESLVDFVYRSVHAAVLAQRRDWFESMDAAHLVLWWVPAGEIPDAEEGVRRLDHLRAHGPTPHAFTLRHRFPAVPELRLVRD